MVPLRAWLAKHVKQLTFLSDEDTFSELSADCVDLRLFERLRDRRAGAIKLLDSEGVIGLIDASIEQIALVRSGIFSIDGTWQVTYSTARDRRDLTPISEAVDLRQWIWQTVWHSLEMKSFVSESDYVRLKFWPHPQIQDRRNVLRMTACFEGGACVRDVANKHNLPMQMVQRFASALIAADLAEQILAESIVKTSTETAVNGGLKRLFSKLRNRLGL